MKPEGGPTSPEAGLLYAAHEPALLVVPDFGRELQKSCAGGKALVLRAVRNHANRANRANQRGKSRESLRKSYEFVSDSFVIRALVIRAICVLICAISCGDSRDSSLIRH